MRKSIYFKLVTSFICIFVLSNVIASMMSYYGSEISNLESLQVQLEKNLDEVKSLNLDPLSIENMSKHNYINIVQRDSLDDLLLSKNQLEILESNETLNMTSKEFTSDDINTPLSIVKVEDGYLLAYANFDNLGFSSRDLIMQINLRALIIGSLFCALLAIVLVKPIQDLIEGTKKVIEGDYSVEIPTKQKDELGDLIRSFNKMTQELQSIEMFRSDFISDISHEFRTPLTSIDGYVKLLNDASEDDRSKYIKIINEEVKRLTLLTSNILMLNNIENQTLMLKDDTFRLDEQIRQSLLLLEPKWSKKSLDLVIDLEAVTITGNENLLSQVWINLLDNAIKFTPNAGQIRITLSHDKILTIQDTGIGISQEDLNRIFEKFYKSDQSRSAEGNGLGLSIVSKIIELHDGNISIHSEENNGTIITIRL